jgi:Replication protein.
VSAPAVMINKINLDLNLDPSYNILSEEHLRTSLDSTNNKLYKNESNSSFFDKLEHDFLTVVCTKCGDSHSVQVPCGYRSCPSCSVVRVRQRRDYLMNKFYSVLSKRDLNHSLRELTLTFKNVKYLSDWLSRFYGWVKAFRRSFKVNKKLSWYNIEGGCGNIEITRNINRKDWHIHVHLAIEGNYIPQELIAEQWTKLTHGMGKIADIRKIWNSRSSAWEIAKYSTKPHNIMKWTYNEVIEFENAVHGRRLFFTFGSWYGDRVYCSEKKCSNCGAINCFVVINLIEPEYAEYLIDKFNLDYG